MLRVWDCYSVLHSIDLCCVCCNAESYAPSPNNGTETMTPWKRVSSAKQTNPNLALYSIVRCMIQLYRTDDEQCAVDLLSRCHEHLSPARVADSAELFKRPHNTRRARDRIGSLTTAPQHHSAGYSHRPPLPLPSVIVSFSPHLSL